MTEFKLKLCPFCGGEAKEQDCEVGYRIICPDCLTTTAVRRARNKLQRMEPPCQMIARVFPRRTKATPTDDYFCEMENGGKA